eukprot:GGOE01015387.1.p1 GENE.GGOE01015387.1~~GGOE01015387.1.p1  ORF type:complete len:449 (+),score=98.07 GGOE01015387.1:34-1380(+)
MARPHAAALLGGVVVVVLLCFPMLPVHPSTTPPSEHAEDTTAVVDRATARGPHPPSPIQLPGPLAEWRPDDYTGPLWVQPPSSTFSIVHPDTPLPRPGMNLTIAMHAYADWIMCTRWGLREYGTQAGVEVLIASWPQPRREPGRYYIWIDLEEPNLVASRIAPHNHLGDGLQLMKKYEAQWDHVLTLCPYTAAWVNRHMQQHRRTAIYYPFTTALVPPFIPFDKRELDVVLVGWYQISPFVFRILKGLAQYKARWVRHHTTVPPSVLRNVTLPHEALRADLPRKLRIISRARIAVVYNAMFDYPFLARHRSPEATHAAIKARPILLSNYAFAYNLRHNLSRTPFPMSPQVKSRMVEAAGCGALMLVFNDGYNVIERYYEPGVDFVYWTDLEDFHRKVRMVLADPATYEAMAQRARRKTLTRYTNDRFLADFLDPFVQAAKGPLPPSRT